MLLRSRIVLPVLRPPVADGAVLIAGNRIIDAGAWADVSNRTSETAVDLGDVILAPGLVNAHCHLDYTGMAGLPPQRQFPDWIKSLLAVKAAASYTDYADAWLKGAGMLAQTGTTTVADIEAVPELLPDVWSSTPLRVLSFLEMTGVRSRRPAGEILRDTVVKLKSLAHPRNVAGLSPHALYSTCAGLLQLTAEEARRAHWRVTMHVAESVEEFDMFRHARGPLFKWLAGQRDTSDCGRKTPVGLVREGGLLGPNFLAVHANYLEPEDIAALAESGSSVAHCPRSHDYFRHAPFPYEQLAAAGVNVCLGTDSLASTMGRAREVKLDMFAEMRQFASVHPTVAPEAIMEMATLAGARALGLERQLGGLFENALADLIAVPFNGRPSDAAAALVHHQGAPAGVMIDGHWLAARPGPV